MNMKRMASFGLLVMGITQCSTQAVWRYRDVAGYSMLTLSLAMTSFVVGYGSNLVENTLADGAGTAAVAGEVMAVTGTALLFLVPGSLACSYWTGFGWHSTRSEETVPLRYPGGGDGAV